MSRSSYHRHPLPPSLVAGLAIGVVVLGVLFFLSALEYAYRRIGVPEGALFALMIASLLGGAVNTTALSLYLLVAGRIWWPALAATAIVTVVVQRAARPVAGLGIAVPALLPPAISASSAILLASSQTAAVAYVSGKLGALIGGDLLNLRKVREMAPAIAAIGGAGSFDGIFLSGLAAVLLVGLL